MPFYKRPLFIALLLTLAVFAVYLQTLTDYGPTWDEFMHRQTGQTYINYFRTGEMMELGNWDDWSWFPPVAVTFGTSLINFEPLKAIYPLDVDRFHLAAVIFASVCIGMVFLIAHRLTDDLGISVFAAGLLASYPQFVAHAHMNVRDIGLTMFYSLTIYILLIAVSSRRPVLMAAVAGLAGGITTDTKQNGAFLLFIGLIWFTLHLRRLGMRKWLLMSVMFGVFFTGAFFAFWPYLWEDTTRRLGLVWHFLTTPEIIAGSTIYFDRVYTSMKDIPVYYPWVMLFIFTPPLMALAVITGLFKSVSSILRDKKEFLIFLWLVVPLSRFLFPFSSISYDQIRHFFEVVPSLAVLAALGLWWLSHSLPRAVRLPLIGFAGAFLLAYNIGLSAAYHPFGTAYFNRFAGPPAYVAQAFDVEFWGNVYRQAVPRINALDSAGKYTYYTGAMGTHLWKENGFLGTLVDDQHLEYDYVVFMNKQALIRNIPYLQWLVADKDPVFTISRGGVPVFYMFPAHRQEFLSTLPPI